jgi:hypothetical protein
MPTYLRSSLCLAAVAVALPLLSVAQTSPTVGAATTPRPRFYVGVAASTSSVKSPDGFTNTPTTPTTRNKSLPILPKLTVGWQLLPRLALQASVQYAKQNDTYSYVEGRIDASGQIQFIPGSNNFRFQSLAVPILARYTLTKDLTRRLQADLLGGVTIVRRTTHFHNDVNIPSLDPTLPPITSLDHDRSSTDIHLSLGPSLRYRLGSHLEATADVLANYLTSKPTSYSGVGPFTGNSPSRFSAAGSVGLRYRFGL